ncbi:MAG: hypothetical protein K2W85_00770 [Phycisphaerales bacterium]|nr:hypothetical protein [Phycisphaerales bacterium]
MRTTLSAAIVCILAIPASAQVTTFLDRAQWSSAAGSQTLLENFEGFAVDTSFRLSPLAIATGFGTLSREGVDRGPSFHLVDVPPYANIDSGTSSGSAFAYLFTDGPEAGGPGTQVRLTFNTPIRAFGMDVFVGSVLEGVTIEIIGAGSQILGTIQPTAGAGGTGGVFAGFVSGEVVSSLRFRSTMTVAGTGGEAFGIDNLAGSPVPAPAAGGLLLLSIVGRRRRRTNS